MTGRSSVPWAPCVLLGLACGPSSEPHDGSHSAGGTHVTTTSHDGSQGSGASETGAPTASTTTATSDASGSSTGAWVDPDCPEVHEGDLIIDAATDLDALRFVGRVDGNLIIEGIEREDLAFLECLHAVDGTVVVQGNASLTSLAGLGNLTYVGGGLGIRDNPVLTSVGDLGPVTSLLSLGVTGNASLPALDLPALEELGELVLGGCTIELDPSLDNPSLQALDGLAGLVQLGNVSIGSQSGLASISRLHEVAAAGGFYGSESFINHNASLPFADVELLMELAGLDEQDLHHCGNLTEPETNECHCENPS